MSRAAGAERSGLRSYGVATMLALGCIATGATLVWAALPARDDHQLLSALRADAELRACDCILHAAWIDESYPRIVVDESRYRMLNRVDRHRFTVEALRAAEAVYAAQWGTPDIYGEVFVVDRTGKALDRYRR